jgi:UDP-GlcNAc:undecaprenyl-phosphate/decaprenyl-phosphate GlcNAc-1-phosphate transferase
VRDHLVVGLIAAVVTALLAFPVAVLARRLGALSWRAGQGPGELPDGGATARVPTMGGLAMFGGLVVALAVAAPQPAFAELFATTSEPIGVLIGATLIVMLGALDDLLDLSALLKLAGQLVVATVVAVLGIQLQYFWLPGVGVLALSADLGLVLTVLFLIAFINVVNLVDGLDGLAAGVVGIGALSFLLYVLAGGGGSTTRLSSATLLATVTLGMAVGFLVHNWYPARVFMGDTGSMLLGLVLGSAGIAHVGRSSVPSAAEVIASVPLAVPLVVLAVPVVDTIFTVLRRLLRDQPVTRADLGHLHHLLVAAGHPHRRAVGLLYLWSAAAGFAVVAPLRLPGALVAGLLLVLVLTASGFTLAASGARSVIASALDAEEEEEVGGRGGPGPADTARRASPSTPDLGLDG